MVTERQKETLHHLILQNQEGIEKLAREEIPEEEKGIAARIRRFIRGKKGETPEVSYIMV